MYKKVRSSYKELSAEKCYLHDVLRPIFCIFSSRVWVGLTPSIKFHWPNGDYPNPNVIFHRLNRWLHLLYYQKCCLTVCLDQFTFCLFELLFKDQVSWNCCSFFTVVIVLLAYKLCLSHYSSSLNVQICSILNQNVNERNLCHNRLENVIGICCILAVYNVSIKHFRKKPQYRTIKIFFIQAPNKT